MAIEQWGFFNMPHLLWHWPTLYNGHLRGPVTLTPFAERLAVELSLPVFTTDEATAQLLDGSLLKKMLNLLLRDEALYVTILGGAN